MNLTRGKSLQGKIFRFFLRFSEIFQTKFYITSAILSRNNVVQYGGGFEVRWRDIISTVEDILLYWIPSTLLMRYPSNILVRSIHPNWWFPSTVLNICNINGTPQLYSVLTISLHCTDNPTPYYEPSHFSAYTIPRVIWNWYQLIFL